MGTGIGYRNQARARMKGQYSTGKICTCLTSLIKTIGGKFPVRQRNSNHNYACTRLQQILSQDSSRTSALSSVSCTELWRRQGTEARITWIIWLSFPIPIPMKFTIQFNLLTYQLLDYVWTRYNNLSQCDQTIFFFNNHRIENKMNIGNWSSLNKTSL